MTEQKTEIIKVRVDPQMKAQLQALAERANETVSVVIRQMIRAGLAQEVKG